MEFALPLLFVGILVFLAHLFSGIFSRTMIPDLLLLILIGLILGPLFGIVTPAHFGSVGPVFTTITLVIILFEEGIQLDLRILRKAMRGAVTLAFFTFLITMFTVGMMTFLLSHLSLGVSFLLGAIVGSITPAVVVPLARQLKMEEESRTLLSLESSLSDVVSIVVTLALLDAFQLGQIRLGHTMGQFLSSILFAVLLGLLGAFGWSILLNRIRTLQNAMFTTPAFVFIIIGLTEFLGYSGVISALAFGIFLGNIELFDLAFLKRYIPHQPITLNETEKIFFSEIVFLLKTFFFVYLGLSIHLTDFWIVSFTLLLTIVIFILRIPAVRVSIPKSITSRDASLIAVMAPKGLAAAVLASLPLQKGIVGGDLIQNITYAVIFFTILSTALLVFLLNRTKLSLIYGWIFRGFSKSSKKKP